MKLKNSIRQIVAILSVSISLTACNGTVAEPTVIASSTPTVPTIVAPTSTSTPAPIIPTASLPPEDYFLSIQNPVGSLAWAKDGKTLAISALSGVHIFDTQSSQIVSTLDEGEFLFPLAMDSVGNHLLAGNKVWDVNTKQLLYQLPLTNILVATFSPDAETLAVSDGTHVTLWNAQTGTKSEKSTPNELGDGLWGLAYSADGNFLYASSADHSVNRVDLVSGQSVQMFTLPEDGCCTLFSPDAKYMIVNRPNHGAGTKELWDVERGELAKDLGQCDSDVYLSAFSPNSDLFAIGPCGADAQLWNASTQQLLNSFPSRSSSDFFPEWRSAVFNSDGTQLALGNDIGQVLIWDVNTNQLINTLSLPVNK